MAGEDLDNVQDHKANSKVMESAEDEISKGIEPLNLESILSLFFYCPYHSFRLEKYTIVSLSGLFFEFWKEYISVRLVVRYFCHFVGRSRLVGKSEALNVALCIVVFDEDWDTSSLFFDL